MSEEMSQGTSTSSTSTSTPTTPAQSDTSAPSSGGNAPTQAGPSSDGGGADASQQKPAWTPDWKYKFNGQEKELDEFFRPLGKDDQALQRLKDFVQRAEAFDLNKPKLKEFETRIGQYEPTVKQVEKLQDWFGKGDHDRVLETLGYSDDMLFKIVKAKLDRQALPETERALYEEKKRVQLENEKLLAQTEMYRSQASQELARVTDYQLDGELGKADYSAVRDAYDRHYGSGAFKQLVISRGATLVERAGKHIPPAELIPMVAKEFAPFISQSAGTPEASPAQGTANPAETQQPKLKVIPQVGRGSASPAKTQVRSLADLKKLATAAQ